LTFTHGGGLKRSVNLSRRELLGLLLAPAVASRCAPRPRRTFPGEIRGGALTLGHRLRQPHAVSSSAPVPVQVLIVGAGPSGLSAAWRLEQLGVTDYRVLELEAQPGGTSAYGDDGVVPHPWGAHYVPVPTRENRVLIRLLDELGVLEPVPAGDLGRAPRARERYAVREPEERVFHSGAWFEGLYPAALASAEDLAELERFEAEVGRLVAWRDAEGRRAFTLPFERCSPAAELVALDRSSAERWLEERGYRSPLLRWTLEYACRDDYGASLADTSAWALLFYFASRMEAPGQPSAPLITWPEGNGRVVRHFAKGAGERLVTGQLVTDVLPRESDVLVTVYDARTERLSAFAASFVVLAVPQFVAARVLRPWRERTPDWVSKYEYGAWLVANLHLRARPRSRGFPFAWDNVIYGSRSLGYVAATHQTLRDRGPTVWTWYHAYVEPPRTTREHLIALDHATATEAVLRDLGPAHSDLEPQLERIDFWRWGHAMVRPKPGFLWDPLRRRARDPVGRVHFAHSDLSGLPLLEEALDQGVRAAEEVAERLGRTFSSLRGAA
jgi:phytoene dehydrogenase-like protein